MSEVNIEFAYPLVKGGIAIHTSDKESRDALFQQLSQESFGGGKKTKLKAKKTGSVFIKNLDTKVSTKEIETKLKECGIEPIECKRIVYSSTQRPTQTVKVSWELLKKFSGPSLR